MGAFKTCRNCSQNVDSSAKFCPNCGSTEFIEVVSEGNAVPNQGSGSYQTDAAPQQGNTFYGSAGNYYQQSPNGYQQPQQPMYGYPQQPVQGQIVGGMYPVQTKKKKGMKWWQILLIVLGVLVLMSVILEIVGFYGSSQKAEYTSGEVEDGVYTNEWLNIRFEIPEGYPEGGADIYEDVMSSSPGSEIGYCSANILTGRQLSIVFENITKGVSEKGYLEAIVKSIKEQWSEAGITADWSGVGKREIAGEQWTSMTVKNISTNNYAEVMCIKIIDNKLCTLTISSDDMDEINDFLDSIETVE